jgi:hypothetical protein
LDGGGGVVLLSLIDVFELLFVLLLPPLSKWEHIWDVNSILLSSIKLQTLHLNKIKIINKLSLFQI